MKASIGALLGGVAVAFGVAAAWELKQGRMNMQPIQSAVTSAADAAQAINEIDINTATREQFMALPGMNGEIADRILDNRPYRSKLDLLSRLVIPQALYHDIKHLLHVERGNQTVKIAS